LFPFHLNANLPQYFPPDFRHRPFGFSALPVQGEFGFHGFSFAIARPGRSCLAFGGFQGKAMNAYAGTGKLGWQNGRFRWPFHFCFVSFDRFSALAQA
jgi:hypothetical protein